MNILSCCTHSSRLKAFISLIIVFFYLYSVAFSFIPGYIGSRVLLGILGFILFALTHTKYIFSCTLLQRQTFGILISIIIWSSFVLFINSTSDYAFVTYPISVIAIFFSSYFVYRVLRKLEKYNFSSLSSLVVSAVSLQILISLVMFLVPSIKSFLFSFISVPSNELDVIEWNSGIRLIGFGSTFFGAGIINGFAILLLVHKLKSFSFHFISYLKCFWLLFFILLGGVFMSRTSVLGFFVGLLLLIDKKTVFWKKHTNYLLCSIITVFFVTYFCFMLSSGLVDSFEVLSSYAFEAIYNYSDTGNTSSVSTNRLLEMYQTYPNNIFTWIFGDGHYSDPFGNGYYMQVDVGYSRLIFYFGLVGLVLFFLFQFYLVRNAIRSFPNATKLFVLSFVLLLALNLKGFADFSPYFLLFSFNKLHNKNCYE